MLFAGRLGCTGGKIKHVIANFLHSLFIQKLYYCQSLIWQYCEKTVKYHHSMSEKYRQQFPAHRIEYTLIYLSVTVLYHLTSKLVRYIII